jgi:methionyl-tRNA synthetase
LAGVYVRLQIFIPLPEIAGRDVLFVCGSDEHGCYFDESKKEDITPQEVIDK